MLGFFAGIITEHVFTYEVSNGVQKNSSRCPQRGPGRCRGKPEKLYSTDSSTDSDTWTEFHLVLQ